METTNLVDALRRRAEVQPESVACIYLGDGEEVKAQLTFAELDRQSRAIAARLQALGAARECVVLLYPAGLEFLSAFFGCLYADVVAVPLPVPRLKGSVSQLLGILRDVDARILMTTAVSLARMGQKQLPLDTLVCLTTEDTPSELARGWRPPAIDRDGVAYLQYTSGSTANRKGVMISHSSVIANLLGIAERQRHEENSVCVNWLPHTHDLGLVSGILQPISHGHRTVILSPTAFVQQPIRWLDAITKYRGTYSSSPNFGYDLCVRRTTREQRERLDLSCWQIALNGAEPVRRQTIDDFVRMFSLYGFRREAMYPAYGLAEATLVVSGGSRGREPITVALDPAQLERDKVVDADASQGARALVGCGSALDSTTVAIVDPVTCEARVDNQIGEIWVRGPGVALGYWNRKDESEQTFQARLASGGGQPYLRTGDLGFVRDGEVFITGRWKDLVIIRGANHYPQDIEWTIEQSHPAFRQGCGAAFSVDVDGCEQLVAVFELEREHLRSADHGELEQIARKAVSAEHDLHLHALGLLKPATIPRTTSGKIQRRQCRADYLAGRLSLIAPSLESRVARVQEPSASPAAPPPGFSATGATSADQLIAWLREYAEERLNSRLMDERRSIAPHVILDFGNNGVLGLQVPRQWQGLELGYRDSLKVIEQLGAIDETLAMMTIVHNWLGIWPISRHAQPALKAEILPRLAAGRELAAFAMTEPAAGSNPMAIESSATPDGPDAWSLRGQKSWSGSAGWAGVINVFAQVLDADGRMQGIGGFVVPRGTRGLRIGPESLTMGMRGMVQNTIYLEGARVTRAQSLGEIGSGMGVAQEAMMQGRLAIGAACVGGIKRSLQLLVRYAGRRSIATGRLLDNPVLLERVGASSAALAGIESVVDRVARRLDDGMDVPADAFVVCKIAASEWLWRAADDLVQFLGGRGYIETNVAAQLLRDARVTRILEGPTEALCGFLGSRALNDGTALHRFMSQGLGAPDVSTRLVHAAQEIDARCTSESPRPGDGPGDARRWSHALIGQVAVDAVLLAAMPPGGPPHHRVWAEQRFEASIASALQRASPNAVRVAAADLRAAVDSYVSSIGDIEQTLAGEDHALDGMLRRGERTDPMLERATAGFRPEVQVDAPAEQAVRRAPVDALAIEQFIVNHVARALKLPRGSVDSNRTFFEYGLDSVTTVMLAASLEDWLGLTISPELVYDVPVIRRFAAHVAERQAAAGVSASSGLTNSGS